jgi:hypothetical protein
LAASLQLATFCHSFMLAADEALSLGLPAAPPTFTKRMIDWECASLQAVVR